VFNSKQLRKLFNDMWREAREAVEPGLPLMSEMREKEYAALIWGKQCFVSFLPLSLLTTLGWTGLTQGDTYETVLREGRRRRRSVRQDRHVQNLSKGKVSCFAFLSLSPPVPCSRRYELMPRNVFE
jgi:hypothetical protein